MLGRTLEFVGPGFLVGADKKKLKSGCLISKSKQLQRKYNSKELKIYGMLHLFGAEGFPLRLFLLPSIAFRIAF